MYKSEIQLHTLVEDKYELQEVIGTGGWSTVYRARQVKLDRPVAIKVLHEHLASDLDKIKRFEQESRLVGSLSHSALAQVFDYGIMPGGQPYIVMEYLEGHSLSERLKRQPPPELPTILSIFIQAAAGLQAAHDRKLIHRDISPANIFICGTDEKPEVKILDFGLAKFTKGEDAKSESLTETGEVLGTRFYLSPEQCMGSAIDHRSDIYSLGCVLFEAITLTKPFDGVSTFECMYKHLNELPPAFKSIPHAANVPKVVETIVLKMMAKEPRDRYQSMQEFGNDIADLHFHERRPFFIKEYLQMWRSRRKASRRIMGGGSSLLANVLIGVLLLGCLWLFWRNDVHNAQIMEAARKNAESLNPAQAWKVHYKQGQRELETGKVHEAVASFEKAAKHGERLGTQDDRLIMALAKLDAAYGKDNRPEDQKRVRERLSALRRSIDGETSRSNMQGIMNLSLELLNAKNDPDKQKALARRLNNQVRHLADEGQMDEARRLSGDNYSYISRTLGTDCVEYAVCLTNVAAYGESALKKRICSDSGLKGRTGGDPMELLLLESMRICKSKDPEGAEYTQSLRSLGDFYLSQRRQDELGPYAEEALKIDEKAGRLEAVSLDYRYLMQVLEWHEKRDQAIECGKKALEIRNSLGLRSTPVTGSLSGSIGESYIKSGKMKEAEPFMQEQLHIYEDVLGEDSAPTMHACWRLGMLYSNMNQYDRAEPFLLRAYNFFHQLAPQDGATKQLRENLAKAYESQGKSREAQRIKSEEAAGASGASGKS